MICLLKPDHPKTTEFAPAMSEGMGILPGFLAVAGKPVHVGFDGGRLPEHAPVTAGYSRKGRTPAPPSPEPDGTTQRNFTDPDSRILLTKDGYIQGYNAQAAVDAAAQIIVAHDLIANMSDQDRLMPLIGHQKQSRPPAQRSLRRRRLLQRSEFGGLGDTRHRRLFATGRAKHPAHAKQSSTGPLTQAMRQKLKQVGRRSRYRSRKQIV